MVNFSSRIPQSWELYVNNLSMWSSQTTSVTKPAVVTVTNQVQKKIISTPKITFVGGTQLKTTGARAEEIKTESVKTEVSSTVTAEGLLLLVLKFKTKNT